MEIERIITNAIAECDMECTFDGPLANGRTGRNEWDSQGL